MPSAFDNEWNTVAESDHQAHFGFPVTYEDKNGSLTIESAILTRDATTKRYNPDGGIDLVTTRTVRFPTEMIKGRQILSDGVFTVEGERYGVTTVYDIEGIRTEVLITKSKVRELSKPNFRRQY